MTSQLIPPAGLLQSFLVQACRPQLRTLKIKMPIAFKIARKVRLALNHLAKTILDCFVRTNWTDGCQMFRHWLTLRHNLDGSTRVRMGLQFDAGHLRRRSPPANGSRLWSGEFQIGTSCDFRSDGAGVFCTTFQFAGGQWRGKVGRLFCKARRHLFGR